ncbi:hypothetical protein ACJX0J_006105, partial [Zea mays]
HIVLYGPIEVINIFWLEQENLKKIEGIGPNLDIEIRGKIVEVEENSRSSIEHRRVTKFNLAQIKTTAFAISQRRAIAGFIARLAQINKKDLNNNEGETAKIEQIHHSTNIQAKYRANIQRGQPNIPILIYGNTFFIYFKIL